MNRRDRDRRIFKELIGFLDKKRTSIKFPGQLMLEIGQFFLGTPYWADTLETKPPEHLIVNLKEHDCVTFIENVVALAWLMEPLIQSLQCPALHAKEVTSRRLRDFSAARVRSGEKSFEVFKRLLQKIRYRHGRLHSYASRLHYFSDWIDDNQKKAILTDVTAEIGGRAWRKPMTFMTTNPDLYPALRNTAAFSKMKSIEKTLSTRTLSFIPKEDVKCLEDRILDGDIVAITTNTVGLDIQHVGLAKKINNRIHLLHASRMEGKVVLSNKTLYRYLMESRARSGIMVARVERK